MGSQELKGSEMFLSLLPARLECCLSRFERTPPFDQETRKETYAGYHLLAAGPFAMLAGITGKLIRHLELRFND